MMTIENRLAAVVSLLPPGEKTRFAKPFALDESADSRLVEAVRALAKAEGLVCMTPGEFSRAALQQTVQHTLPAEDEHEPDAIAVRFAAITDPRAQTAFWRSLNAEHRAAILKAK